MAAAAENYYASNNDSYVTNIEDARSRDLGEVKEITSGKKVDYAFYILTQESKHMRYDMASIVALDRYENYEKAAKLREFTDSVFDQFSKGKLCTDLSRSFLESTLVLKRPDSFLIRIESEEDYTILGMAAFYFHKSYVFIDILCAHKDYSGAGTVLLNKIHQIARAAGKTRAALNSVNSAVGFYKKRKYKKVRMPFTPANVPMSRRLTKKNTGASASAAASAGAGSKGGRRLRQTYKHK